MTKISIALLALILSGCASVQRPSLHVMAPKVPIVKGAPIVKAAPPAVTPNQIVKKRFWDRFPKHPKFFH